MIISDLIISCNNLKMLVRYESYKNTESPKFKIHFIECQLRMFADKYNYFQCLLIKLTKCVDDGMSYISTVHSSDLKIKKTMIIDGNDWYVLGFPSVLPKGYHVFNIEIIIDIKVSPSLRLFIKDDSWIDFEIKGTDGSIRVHKIVLATASEVFRKMITDDFKEKKEALIDLPYSKCVLEDLKDYIYLQKLNNENLECLLTLADCYMMCELKQECINRMFLNIIKEKTIETTESLN